MVYSHIVRLHKICSQVADFRKNTMEMKSCFVKRGYPNDVIQKEMKKAKFSKILCKKDNTKGV